MYFHSVTLDQERCKGCTNCIKQCPTQAIRVRNGKAKIIKERCIDCGECIRVCPYHAKKAVTDPLERIFDFAYRVALPAPALYGQFAKEHSVDMILTALLELGFDDVFEVARGAEVVSRATRQLLESGTLQTPVISSACPAVLRLITVRFPNLIGNVLPLQAPVEVAAQLAREEAVKKTGLAPEQIGIFFLSPCAAKATAIRSPLGRDTSGIDGTIAIKTVYKNLLTVFSKIEKPLPLSKAGASGIGWAKLEGESQAIGQENFVAADGISHCIKVLEEVEDDRLRNIQFIELSSCVGGCVGGPLNVENAYIAKNRVKKLAAKAGEHQEEAVDMEKIRWNVPVLHRSILNLDDNMVEAMKKMEEMEYIYSHLPQIDCGACGAPTCKCLAEDIVRGFANETDCIFKLREKVRNLAVEMMELESKMPPAIFDEEEEEEK